MPLFVQSHRDAAPRRDALIIGLVNNMPDSALEGTETQFSALLRAACGERPVCLRYASLPEVPRGAEAQTRIAARYWSLDQLFEDAPDALIVTGTEPKNPRLNDEPYWERLSGLIDYADRHVISSVWSCLAAHAAALHLDGIERQRLPTKRFGVFEQVLPVEDPLMRGLGPALHTPHSRWNDLPLAALSRAGYRILSHSQGGEVDVFTKTRRSLMVFFQGHPEYEQRTLLKEYQRDVLRFISGEYVQYPNPPVGYFNAAALAELRDFERRLRAGEIAESLAAFPFATLAASLEMPWRAPAVQMYRNWLDFIAARKFATAMHGLVKQDLSA